MNILTIDNHRAVITYDPDTDMLRGEFLGLIGGADFYASDIPTLKAQVPGGFP
jgi:predicted HicB family RNase H-like nuclease